MGLGGSNSATQAATAANAQTQQQIQQSVAGINAVYSSPARQQQYSQYGNALKDYYTGQVNNQEAINARNLKFAMARSGLKPAGSGRRPDAGDWHGQRHRQHHADQRRAVPAQRGAGRCVCAAIRGGSAPNSAGASPPRP